MEKTISNTVTVCTDKILDIAKTSYVTIVLSVLGVFAFATAILVAYPAIAYFASKLV